MNNHKVTKITYAALRPTYQYANEKIEIEMMAFGKDDPGAVLEDARRWVHDRLNDRRSYEEWREECIRIRKAVVTMREEIAKASRQYEELKRFFIAQGVRAADDFPEIPLDFGARLALMPAHEAPEDDASDF